MKNFRPYLNYLDKIVDEAIRLPLSTASLDAALDGQPADELRRLVSLDEMRSTGAFFTSSKLSKIALQKFVKSLDEQSIILDPACGAGDLLIACAMHLPKGRTLKSTLQIWGDRIMGRDLHPEFIRATKNRLVLAAIREDVSINDHRLSSLEALFPQIEERNGLSDYDAIRAASHIVINPPFTMVETPENCSWASGKINAAALFLEACIEQANNGTRIMAILPDVLRSGSRYRKWREIIERRTRQLRLQLYGQFDQWADVDVFILELEVQQNTKGGRSKRWKQPGKARQRIGDRFNVCIGPVVDYRDPHQGPRHPFIKPRDLAAWETVNHISQNRRFKGRILSPPFVVVRRTSRLGDKHRAVGTIISHAKPVAVENHLIALLPKDDSLETCQGLLRVLKRPETTQWLNQRIRCRHLTVSSLAELPWWGEEG